MLIYMFYFIYYTLGKPFLFQKNSNCIICFGNKKLLSLVFELCLNIVSNVCLVPLLSIQPWTSPLPRQCSTRVPSKRQLKAKLRKIQFQFQNFVIALACKFSFGILIKWSQQFLNPSYETLFYYNPKRYITQERITFYIFVLKDWTQKNCTKLGPWNHVAKTQNFFPTALNSEAVENIDFGQKQIVLKIAVSTQYCTMSNYCIIRRYLTLGRG